MPGSIILPDMPACSVSVKNNVKTFPAIAKNNYHIKSANVICCPQPFSSKVFRYSNISFNARRFTFSPEYRKNLPVTRNRQFIGISIRFNILSAKPRKFFIELAVKILPVAVP